ncbi:MAG: hypothetical protein Q8L52_02825 [bacterium]|nr:hypothetical protein [bacterium]
MSQINLQDRIRELRDLINSSICYKQDAWNRKDEGSWSKLWTAVDNLEDTQLAIDEYVSLKNFSRLAVYGLLQSMYVQQDAISHLEKAINIPIPDWKKDYPGLSNIRDIRNETIGHPISEKGIYTSISHTDNLNVLDYVVWSKEGFQHKTIDLKDIVNTQHNLLIKEIERVMEKISTDEELHRHNFKDKSLLPLLVSTGYLIQKLWSFEKSREYAQVNFDSLKSIYENFKEEIKKRFKIDKVDEQGVQIPGLILVVQHVEKILPRIEKMVPMDNNVDQLDLDVYVESLDRSFDDLRKMVKEIDDKFKVL